MKTDLQLKSDVVDELAATPTVNATRIGVAVKNGVVTLAGEVETYLEKHAVERAVRRVSGVRGIAMELEVNLAPHDKRSDADIAEAATDALRWQSLVPEGQVQVTVEDGRATLTGEVDWSYQSDSAADCIRPLVGIRGVRNEIRLKLHAHAMDIRAGIEAALARHAQREARRIAVDVAGSVVTLRGEVGSMAEHDAAIGTAHGARGVTRVIDALLVID